MFPDCSERVRATARASRLLPEIGLRAKKVGVSGNRRVRQTLRLGPLFLHSLEGMQSGLTELLLLNRSHAVAGSCLDFHVLSGQCEHGFSIGNDFKFCSSAIAENLS